MTKQWVGRAIVVWAFVVPATAVADELVVLESTSGKYELGDIVQTENQVRLAEGETLKLVAEGGEVYRHRGPYEGLPVTEKKTDDTEVNLLSAVAALVASNKGNVGSLGATRDLGLMDELPAPDGAPPWSLLVDRGGDQCVVAGAAARFWRSDADADVKMVVTQVSPKRSVELDWAAGQHELDWPNGIAREDGALYLIRTGASLRARQLTLREISSRVAEGPQVVAWLKAKGCLRQAQALYTELQARARERDARD